MINNTLIVFAMPEEHGRQFSDSDFIVTGIGEINAAYELTKAIYTRQVRPKTIINLGSAGSPYFNMGTIVNPTIFKHKDKNNYLSAFDREYYGIPLDNYKQTTCYSGNTFDSTNSKQYDVVDMEAYALAKVCHDEKIPFLCLKCITDDSNIDAMENWTHNIVNVPTLLRNAYNHINLHIT